MKTQYNIQLLEKFDELIKQIMVKQSNFKQLENDIYLFKNHPSEIIDLYINCCTHGNETIGLSIAINLLKKILKQTLLSKLNIGIGIANRKAIEVDARSVGYDMNRSFAKTTVPVTYEEVRARNLEMIALQSNSILDIHQTTNSSISPFFVLKESSYNFNFFNSFQMKEWPVILYKEGNFSKDGEAYSSYCLHKKIPFITVELGLAGENEELSALFSKKIIAILTKHDSKSWKVALENSHAKLSPGIATYQEAYSLQKITDDDYIIDNLLNLSLISKGTLFAYQNSKPIYADFDCYALFPKYGIFKKSASELVRIIKKNS